jgi:hypothetical protein
MFPAGRQLPLLQHVSINSYVEDKEDYETRQWCVDDADISGIAVSCTELQWLQLVCCQAR